MKLWNEELLFKGAFRADSVPLKAANIEPRSLRGKAWSCVLRELLNATITFIRVWSTVVFSLASNDMTNLLKHFKTECH